MNRSLCLKKLLQVKVEVIFTVVHFLLTFLWERSLFLFSDSNWDVFLTEAKSDYISNSAESVIVYVISKIFAGILIFLLWKLIFAIVKKRIPKSKAMLFGMIYLVGFIVGIISFPSTFGLEIDNFTNYMQAIRFLPLYWQSIYTGTFYAGCMMVIPHPFSIFMFQWLSFVSVIAYIYTGIERFFQNSRYKYIAFLFLFLPESYYIMFNAYRNNLYTILCLFYFSYILFSSCQREKRRNLKEMIAIAVLSAFIMVWRSEGILVGVGGVVFLILFAYKIQWKRMAMLGITFIVSFMIVNNIQGIGSKKYYGQDYMIINTTNVLYSILNNPEANFLYEGAEEDLANIEAVVPVEILKESATTGYRNYNWTTGRKDFNQTFVDDDTAKRYMHSYYRIILHNKIDYLNVQINCFFKALQISASHTTYAYTGDSYVELQSFVYDGWRTGSEEVRDTFLTEKWENNGKRIYLYSVLDWFMAVWRELWVNTGINVILHSGAIIADVLILLLEVIRLFENRKKEHLKFVILFLVLIGEMLAVLLFMPEGRAAYLYPILYTSYFLITIYIIRGIDKRKNQSFCHK